MNQRTLLNNVMFQTLPSYMQTENEKEKKKHFYSSFLRDNVLNLTMLVIPFSIA